MKMNLIGIILLFAIIGCKKENKDYLIKKEDLLGKWVNISIDKDTLFWANNVIKRIDTITMLPKHSYAYILTSDSVRIKYTGEYYIEVLESSYLILLNDDKSFLTIMGIDNYFPKYKGNQFRKILKK